MTTLPLLVVSLPARSVDDARAQARTAADAGGDLAEIRVDRFPPRELERLDGLFPTPLGLIATLRSRVEGGEGPDEPEARLRILRILAKRPFRLLDIERARDLDGLPALQAEGASGFVVSQHSLSPVPRSSWSSAVRASDPTGSLVKFVAPASVGQLLHEIVPELPPPGEVAVTAATTGASGPLLRAWSRTFGFPLVYASLPSDAGGDAAVEPSQIPVDRLAPFLRADPPAPLFAVVGHPIAHTKSPAIHALWMRAHSNVGLYVALDISDESEFVDALPLLADQGFRGLNVTHPLKAAAIEVADRVENSAEVCGVANTLSFIGGEVVGENTDLAGILRRMSELRSEGRWDGRSVGVLGAGGAARATLAAARQLGAEARLWSRRESAGAELAQEMGARFGPGGAGDLPSLVVHATPMGRADVAGSSLPDLGWIRAGVHVVDWVYAPDHPVVRSAAEKLGASYEDGTRLLVYQASASYSVWWDREPTEPEVRSALEVVR